MPTTICPGCGRSHAIKAEFVGRRATCNKCGTKFRIELKSLPRPCLDAKPHPSSSVVKTLWHSRVAITFGIFGLLAAGIMGVLLAIGITSTQHDSNARSTKSPQPAPLTVTAKQEAARAEWWQEYEIVHPAALPDANPASGDLAQLVEDVWQSVAEIKTDRGIGSGFIVSANGDLLTNYHVIEGSRSGTAVFEDGNSRSIEGFLAYSAEDDLALLRITNARALPPLIVSIELPRQGDRVLAFGSPYGLSGTVSDGIVSALRNREATELVQTTAAISEGNSGGPLVDLQGKVVGVNTFFLSSGQNLNFAVAATTARAFMDRSPNRVQPLSALPAARPDPREIASKAREQEIATAEERRRAEEKRRLETIAQTAQRLQAEESRQRELDRLSEQIQTVRAEIAILESDGAKLATARGRVVAEGQAVEVRANQLANLYAVSQLRMKAITDAISRRRLAIAGGAIFTDSESASYDEFGIAQLEGEARVIQVRATVADEEFKLHQTNYARLDSQARDLAGQILYKTQQRDALVKQLADLTAAYDELR